MKIYNLDIDTSKPINQVVQMQQNETGLLKLNVTNDGKSIRNLSCTIYDGDNEISATNGGFKIDVGNETKAVKIGAKSEPIVCNFQIVAEMGTGHRTQPVPFSCIQLPVGIYRQEDFYEGLKKVYYMANIQIGIALELYTNELDKANFRFIRIITDGNLWGIYFYDINHNLLPTDESIVFIDTVDVCYTRPVKQGTTYDYIPYTFMGENTDYQLDMTIRPSANAPYDGKYTEPLTEIEVDGVKFVPTTLSVDGVEYKVLAEAQPTPDPEEPVEPTEG